MGESHVGVVKWFNRNRGYGFITYCDESTNNEPVDIFVHYSCIISPFVYKALSADEKVNFVIGNNGVGPVAVDVIPVFGVEIVDPDIQN